MVPPEHRQQVDGNMVSLSTYSEADQGMMESDSGVYGDLLNRDLLNSRRVVACKACSRASASATYCVVSVVALWARGAAAGSDVLVG